MDYVKTKSGKAIEYPYSVDRLRRDNPSTSFPETVPDAVFADLGVYPIEHLGQPSYDSMRQKIVQDVMPSLNDGKWQVGWSVVALTAEEVAAKVVEAKAQQEAKRKAAYTAEADPLFFMSQRGEATVEEWQAKVAEIKARYPYPEETQA